MVCEYYGCCLKFPHGSAGTNSTVLWILEKRWGKDKKFLCESMFLFCMARFVRPESLDMLLRSPPSIRRGWRKERSYCALDALCIIFEDLLHGVMSVHSPVGVVVLHSFLHVVH